VQDEGCGAKWGKQEKDFDPGVKNRGYDLKTSSLQPETWKNKLQAKNDDDNEERNEMRTRRDRCLPVKATLTRTSRRSLRANTKKSERDSKIEKIKRRKAK